MYAHSFNGTRFNTLDKSILDKDFTCIDLDDSKFYVTKKTYQHREDVIEFDYKYLIEVMDMRCYDESPAPAIVSLYLVPTFDSWKAKDIEDFRTFIGLDEEDFATDKASDTLYSDVPSYGHNLLMGSDKVDDLADEETLDSERVMEMVHSCANILMSVDGLLGFYLDRPQNRLGTSGWDYLKEWLTDGYDALKATIERYSAKGE